MAEMDTTTYQLRETGTWRDAHGNCRRPDGTPRVDVDGYSVADYADHAGVALDAWYDSHEKAGIAARAVMTPDEHGIYPVIAVEIVRDEETR